ncbi:MAG: c-type cytochrome [Burkholderiales bacterium]|nr:c-type cytochrome [Burkholderiales bacterium]
MFEANCGACHNLDLPRSQRLTRDVWDEVIRDMVEKFNATWITGPKAEIIGAYLAKYRGPEPKPEPELPPELQRWQPEDPKIRALLTERACLACHTLERPLIGPPFAVVAERYRGDPAARERLAKKIRAGGAGAWGSVAMPPNTGIPDAELKTIVDWVLSRK